VGAVSAYGEGAETLSVGLASARTALSPIPELRALGLPVTWGGAVPITGEDRDRRLARAAIDEALMVGQEKAERCSFYWATGLDTFQDQGGELAHRSSGSCFAHLARDFARPRRMIALACASGTSALGEAFRAVRTGVSERAVAGGSSVMLTPFYVTGFSALGALAADQPDPTHPCRPFDQARSGFTLADGAGALLVETLESARQRCVDPVAEILGYGTSQDAFDMNRPPEDGAGAERCIRAALADADLDGQDVAAICAHGTGTVAGDTAEAAALGRVFASGTPVFGIKGAIGHAMAAAGALEAIACVAAVQQQCAPKTVGCQTLDPAFEIQVTGERQDIAQGAVISTSFGMGGQNAAIIIGGIGE